MKQKKCYAGIRNLLPITYLFLFLLLFGQQIVAQTSLNITSKVPTGQSEALNVGVGTSSFDVDIANTTSSSTHISNLIVSQPKGVRLVSVSAQIANQNVPVTLQNDSTIMLNIDLPGYQKLTVQYLKKASCSAVPDGTTNFSVQVNDQIIVTSTLGIQTVSTNSYPILFPGLQVKTPSSVNNANVKTVLWRQPFTDSIPVINASSAGNAQNMLFSMKWANTGAVSITEMSIRKSGGKAVAVTPYIQGDSAIISIDSSLLATMGFVGGILTPADSFKVFVTAIGDDIDHPVAI